MAWFFIEEAKTDSATGENMCMFRGNNLEEGSNYELKAADSMLIDMKAEMMWTHIICFFLISIASWISVDDLDSHFQVFFNIISVLTYQITIIDIWLH